MNKWPFVTKVAKVHLLGTASARVLSSSSNSPPGPAKNGPHGTLVIRISKQVPSHAVYYARPTDPATLIAHLAFY